MPLGFQSSKTSTQKVEIKYKQNPQSTYLLSIQAKNSFKDLFPLHFPSNNSLCFSSPQFSSSIAMPLLHFSVIFVVLTIFLESVSGDGNLNRCRSYCGNITVDFPFTTQSGCGHHGYRDLLFCVNDVLMLHITSGSYRVLEIDYAYQALTIHDPYMSTCNSIVRGVKANGFVVEPWRAQYLIPAPDNIFMLIGCTARSPLFQGFPEKHLPCRNVSGMGCEEYYGCPAWGMGRTRSSTAYGLSPPECCSVSYNAIRAINLTKLECQGYSSAYSLAPLRLAGPGEWSYGIRVKYSVPGDSSFCQACEATGGTCGHDAAAYRDLCLCDGWNSTTTCDAVPSASSHQKMPLFDVVSGFLACIALLWNGW